MPSWIVLAVAFFYVGLLFAIAWHGDRKRGGDRGPLVYSLSLAVFCTSWTFYGSVGRAATNGLDFLPIYIGPILVFGPGWPLVRRIVHLAKQQNSVSISDFLAVRYGKSQAVAALVTLVAVVGTVPYLALQLKAVSASYRILAASGDSPAVAACVTLFMALFAILFGVRNIDASEHHRGLMRAIAFESLVKLAAFLAVGAAATWLFAARPTLSVVPLLQPKSGWLAWWSTVLLAGIAALCLPRQFQVAVVENNDERDVKVAAWMFPLYLLLINLFVLPLAAAGLSSLGSDADADMFVLSLPLRAGSVWLALFAFIGGLSAASGMVIVETVALSTMVCNDVVVPLALRLRPDLGGTPGGRIAFLLGVRRGAVILILMLGYLYYEAVRSSYSLVSIGLISFSALAQIGPTLIGGLFWRRGSRIGALAGISVGFVTWLLMLVFPSLSSGFASDWSVLGDGDPVARCTLVSLCLNAMFYVGFSILSAGGAADRHPTATLADLIGIAGAYLGADRAARAYEGHFVVRGRGAGGADDHADAEDIRFTERLLAGMIGAASARVVVAGSLEKRGLSRAAAMAILDEASQAIRFNRALLTATLDNVPQGICLFDKESRLAAWNQRFIELNALPADLVKVGTTLDEVRRARGSRQLGDREVDFSIAGTYLHELPDGAILEIATAPVREGGFVATYTDVTERHRIAAALREANESLEQRIAERTMALSAAKAEADEANRAKTRMLTAVSHDLVQPLHAARLLAGALADKYPDRLVDRVDHALRSLESVLGALLEVAKLDGGAVVAKPAAFRLDKLFAALSEEFSIIAGDHGLAFASVGCGLGVVSDPVLLRRILQNFLANAIRYTPSGRILLGCRRRAGKIRIEVWDTGIGIPPGELSEIFKEFRQVDPGGGADDRGLGLGLAIVERIAALLGHPVHVHSVPGKGSCFAVEVPLANQVDADRTEAAIRRRKGMGGALVVCIDNDPIVLEGTSALLEGWDCRVIAAADGAGAIRQLNGERPQALVVDYHLDRGVNGVAAAEEISARSGGGVPVIVVTADHADAIKRRVEEKGFILALKPVRPAALRALLGRVLKPAA